jgi:RNase P subunit RPR2
MINIVSIELPCEVCNSIHFRGNYYGDRSKWKNNLVVFCASCGLPLDFKIVERTSDENINE